MTILVCPLSRVTETIRDHAPERVVSLLDPGFDSPVLGPSYVNRHLRLSFHDIHKPAASLVMPAAKHVDHLLSFVMGWQRAKPILVHCRAGIGRSTAAAFITACFYNRKAPEHEIALALREIAPHARPNETLVRLADRVLERGGRMIAAIADTRPWVVAE